MAETRSPQTTRVALVSCGLVAVALAVFALLREGDAPGEEAPAQAAALETGVVESAALGADAPAPSATPAAAPEAASAAAEVAAKAPAAPGLGLDLVRVEPDGAALVAGRAAPGAEVTVRAGEQVLATVEADASGAFVAAFETPPDAPRGLTVSSAAAGAPATELALTLPETLPAPEGFAPAAGGTSAPPPAPPAEPEVAALAAPASEPAPPSSASETATAAPASALYSSAEATAASEATPAATPPPAAGARIPTEIAAAPIPDPGPRPVPGRDAAGATVVVVPGTTLWGLARAHYGAGRRYPAIVSANRDEIGDPALIFPGQRLVLPPAVGLD